MHYGEKVAKIPRARLERICKEKQQKIYSLNNQLTDLKRERNSLKRKLAEVTKNEKS